MSLPLCAAIGVLTLTTTAAFAQEGAAVTPEPTAPEEVVVTHYRWSLLGVSVGSALPLGALLLDDGDHISERWAIPLLATADIAPFVSGAFVHAAHHQ